MNTYKTKTFKRFASFVYDVYNNCQRAGFTGIYKLCRHHGVSKSSAVQSIRKSGNLKSTTVNGRPIYTWDGNMPEMSDIKKLYDIKQGIELEMNMAMNAKIKAQAPNVDLFTQDEPVSRDLPYRVGRPTGDSPGADNGLKAGETRFATVMDKELAEKIRRLSYWDRRTIKAEIEIALRQRVAQYEAEHGELMPIPEQREATNE